MHHAPDGHTADLFVYGVAGRPLSGEAVSGDRHVVRRYPGGAFLAVIDGLGHGVEAAAAAEAAVAVLQAHAEQALVPLAQRCHEALVGGRGAAISMVALREADGAMSWLGVGNVEGVLVRADRATATSREALLTRGGIVGYKLPPLKASVVQLEPGDTLALASDGIGSGFPDEFATHAAPQDLANRILDRHGKATDDALVLVARWLGSSS